MPLPKSNIMSDTITTTAELSAEETPAVKAESAETSEEVVFPTLEEGIASGRIIPPEKYYRDWRRVKTVPPMSVVAPYIMETRNTCSNHIKDRINVARAEKYIKEKQRQGYKNFSMMHLFIAAYIRTVSQRPALNRFIRGHKIYTRENVEIALVIKKEMTLESPDTAVKAIFRPDATAIDVYNQLNDIIEKYRNNPGGDFDETVKFLRYIPGVLLLSTIRFLRLMDYFNLLPKFLAKVSPFHASFFITSMGSLGIPPIYHHLYDFGNVPVFLAFGSKERVNELNSDGTVHPVSYMDFAVVTDERICDGFYFASALKYMKNLLKNPHKLDVPAEEIIKDIR